MYGTKLEAERKHYMNLNAPDLCHKRPLFYDVVEGKPFTCRTESSRTRIEVKLLLTFLKIGGRLWALESYWNQVGVMTRHSLSTAEFKWSLSHPAVGVILICNFRKVRGRAC